MRRYTQISIIIKNTFCMTALARLCTIQPHFIQYFIKEEAAVCGRDLCFVFRPITLAVLIQWTMMKSVLKQL